MDHCNGGRIKTNAYSKIWEQVNLLEGSKPIVANGYIRPRKILKEKLQNKTCY